MSDLTMRNKIRQFASPKDTNKTVFALIDILSFIFHAAESLQALIHAAEFSQSWNKEFKYNNIKWESMTPTHIYIGLQTGTSE